MDPKESASGLSAKGVVRSAAIAAALFPRARSASRAPQLPDMLGAMMDARRAGSSRSATPQCRAPHAPHQRPGQVHLHRAQHKDHAAETGSAAPRAAGLPAEQCHPRSRRAHSPPEGEDPRLEVGRVVIGKTARFVPRIGRSLHLRHTISTTRKARFSVPHEPVGPRQDGRTLAPVGPTSPTARNPPTRMCLNLGHHAMQKQNTKASSSISATSSST